MNNVRIPAVRTQAVIGLSVFILGIWIAWLIGGKIATQDMGSVAYAALGMAGAVVAVTILRNWRLGFYFFLVWFMFEDLVRKFMGNNMAIYFAKDVLLGLTYLSFFLEVRAGRVKRFRPPFMFFLYLFIWLGVIQVFNSNSPNILYGLLGLKVYFYYIPLMFVGYALDRKSVV